MRTASVGFHCPECVKAGSQRVVRPQARRASRPITVALIAVNVAAFAAVVASGGRISTGNGDLVDRFATTGYWVASGEWWRLLTGTVLHAGPVHLALNMCALWVLGGVLERDLGAARFLSLYLAGGIGGSLGVMLLDPDSATVGASGAIFGMLGTLLVLQMRRGINPWQSGLGGILLLNLGITFAIPGISIGGHLGGLAAGALAGWASLELAGPRGERKAAAAAATLVVAAILFWAALVAARSAFPGLG